MPVLLETSLRRYDSATWARASDSLRPAIHEVDRNATQIWLRFFPLVLADAFAETTDPAQLAARLRLDGRYRLAEQCDTSHRFLYGHRFWVQLKATLAGGAGSGPPDAAPDLPSLARGVARDAAVLAGADESLLVGITLVALMTLRQVGLQAFLDGDSGDGSAAVRETRTPEQVLAARAMNDKPSVLGRLLGLTRQYSVTFDESRPDGRFALIGQQHLTTAAAGDQRPYAPDRGFSHDGPLPAQCRGGSCGTCWVGVLSGADRLSEVEPLEARRLKECGYLAAAAGTPIIRLACMAKGSGNVTIVIPPWNGFLTKGGLPEG